MCTEEQFAVVERVKIVDRRAGTELDSLDFLQVDEEHRLLRGRHTAELDTAERLCDARPELPVEERGRRREVDFIVAGLRRVVDDLPAVEKHHELILADVNDRPVGNEILGAALVGGTFVVFAYLDPARQNGGVGHMIGFQYLEPGVGQTAADGARNRFNNPHCILLSPGKAGQYSILMSF